MSLWEKKRISDITLKVGSGATPRGGQSVYFDQGEISLIRSQNIYDYEFKNDGLVYISKDAAEKLKNVTLEENDILLNITGDSVGRCCIVPCEVLPARVNQHVAIIRVDENTNPYYLMYYLNNPRNKEALLNQVHGGTRKALTKGIIEDFEVEVPSKIIQDKIADILETLDGKIKLNNRMNQTLEEMATTLYKHWFVDFGPFQDGEFLESELGMIPKGWEVSNLNEYCLTVTDGAHASPKEVSNNDKIIGTVKDMDDYAFDIKSCKQISDEDFERLVKGNCQPESGDVLLSKDGTMGKVLYIGSKIENLVTLSSIAILRPKYSSVYLYLYLRNPSNIEKIINGYATGSALNRLVLKNIRLVPILLPPHDVLSKFEQKVRDMISLIESNEKEKLELQKTRDYLLPKLISGDIHLSRAEKEVEKVL